MILAAPGLIRSIIGQLFGVGATGTGTMTESQLRALLGQFLGAPGASGMTEPQIRDLVQRLVTGALPMTPAEFLELRRDIEAIKKALRGKLPKPDDSTSWESPSPEVERARARVQRLVVEGARRAAQAAPDVAAARASVARLVTEGAARGGQGGTDVAAARASVARLVAEGERLPRPTAVGATAVASRAK
jgi:hypothetical protein